MCYIHRLPDTKILLASKTLIVTLLDLLTALINIATTALTKNYELLLRDFYHTKLPTVTLLHGIYQILRYRLLHGIYQILSY